MPQLIKVAGWTEAHSASVIFIHGLNGNAYDTWRLAHDPKSFWPVWLSEDVEGLTAYSLSYEAPVSNWLGTAMPLQDRAVTLLELMIAEPALQQGPITLVCHSLGGLLAKQMLREASDRRDRVSEASCLLDQIRKIVFIATPHSGSYHANFLDRVRLIAWPSAASKALVANDPALRNLNVWYRNWSASRGIKNLVFYEMRQTAAGTIVDAASSDPGLVDTNPIPLDTDHVGTSKPRDRTDILYVRTRDVITERNAGRLTSKTEHSKVETLGDFRELPLVTIPKQHPRNYGPIAIRIAVILVLGLIIAKGIQSIVRPPNVINLDKLVQKLEVSAVEKSALTAEIERIKTAYDINALAIETFLKDVGETPVAVDQYAAQLRKFAERYRGLLATAQTPSSLPAQFEAIRKEAAEKIRSGSLDDGERLLSSLSERMSKWTVEQQNELNQSKRAYAAVIAEQANLANTRLRFKTAASLFGQAAELVPSDQRQSWQYRANQAVALLDYGRIYGERDSLIASIQAHRDALNLVLRSTRSNDWAWTQASLAIALDAVGERDGGTTFLEEAVVTFKEALKVRTPKNDPTSWATTQNNLASTLRLIGTRKNSVAPLQEAEGIVRETLTVLRADQNPVEWADAQVTLGLILYVLGDRTNSTNLQVKGAIALREALKVQTLERTPAKWAETQYNLAIILSTLGERSRRTDLLEQSAAALREVLKVRDRASQPLQWAATQDALGGTLWKIGERERGTLHLIQAVNAYRQALEERTRNRAPLDWAATQQNLCVSLQSLGDRQNDLSILEEAVAACREALTELTFEKEPIDWARAQNSLGVALREVGRRAKNPVHLMEAATAYRAALKVWHRDTAPHEWVQRMFNLAGVLSDVSGLDLQSASTEEVIDAYRQVAEIWTKETNSSMWSIVQHNLGWSLFVLGKRENGVTNLEESVKASRAALTVQPQNIQIMENLSIALAEIGKRTASRTIVLDALYVLDQALALYREKNDVENTAAAERQRDAILEILSGL